MKIKNQAKAIKMNRDLHSQKEVVLMDGKKSIGEKYSNRKLFDDASFKKSYVETRSILRKNGWLGRFRFS